MLVLLGFVGRAGCPSAWWWLAWRGWRTSLCPRKVRRGTLRKLPESFHETMKLRKINYLKSANSSRLEAEISLEILRDFSDETLEGKLADEKLGRFLVSSDFSKSDGSWSVSVRLLHASGRWSRFSSSLKARIKIRGILLRDDPFWRFIIIICGWEFEYSTLVASCFRGAFPPVDLRAVCLVRAIFSHWKKTIRHALILCNIYTVCYHFHTYCISERVSWIQNLYINNSHELRIILYD